MVGGISIINSILKNFKEIKWLQIFYL
jgi:hypothetical protein